MTRAILALLSNIYREWLLPRLAVAASLGFIMLALSLAGCTNDRIPVDRETVAAHEITDIPWPWCTADQLIKCPYIRQDGELFMLPLGTTVGDGAGLGGDVWDEIGEIVHAIGNKQ